MDAKAENAISPGAPTSGERVVPAGSGKAHRVVVVGGGAAGLELASRLGNRLGKRRRAEITLIDNTMTHIWKPLLHQVAVGTMDAHRDELDYLSHARGHGFRFRLGSMAGLDRSRREVALAPVVDEDGKEVIPRRSLRYDSLVIAVGSVSNDFDIPGVREHCLYVDTRAQADRVQRTLLNSCLRAHTHPETSKLEPMRVAIVGAGATGVELAAEIHKATRTLVAYGLDQINPETDVKIAIVEAADRVLPALSTRLSKATEGQLRRLGIEFHTRTQVTEVTPDAVETNTGLTLPAQIKIWAAGIKAPPFLRACDGLETNRQNQLVVTPTLQTTADDNIFAIGDCACCTLPGEERPLPPRAQTAHQQAAQLARNLARRVKGQPLLPFRYRDYGSLVSISHSTIGNLMGNLLGSVMIEGWLARMAYLSLYKKHQLVLHGTMWVALSSLGNLVRRRTHPALKLH